MKDNNPKVKRCIELMIKNGFKIEYNTYDVLSYSNNCIGVDIDLENDEIVFLDDSGDFLHIPVSYYALLGALVEFRQIPFNFVSIHQK